MTDIQKQKLKAFFSAKFMRFDADVRSSGGCDTCDYGSEEGMSMEKIGKIIDEFNEEAVQ